LLDWWADYPDGDNFLYPLFATASFGPGGNYAFYSDPETDVLIAQARRTTDDSARAALYRRIDERVYRAAPWLYLWFPVDLWASAPTRPPSRNCAPSCTSTIPCPCSSGTTPGACCAATWGART